ncbi:hypothetical protein AB0K05_38260 [Nonomuraea sp. NPDC049486]|uniref:hypothetical protein n=1 Tax=Nonomuraea sp. NPDC049486 TaxID=3155773 RepID=UPI00342923B6
MAMTLRSFRDTVDTYHGGFQLDDLYGVVEGPSLSDGVLETAGGWMRVESGVRHGRADVRLEIWDSDPPPAPAPWTAAGESAYLSAGGIVTMGDDEGERSLGALVLGPPCFLYGVRAHRVPPARGGDGDFWEDPRQAHVLLRFWPLRDVFDPALHARPAGLREDAAALPSGYVPSMDWPVLRERTAPPPRDGSGPDVTGDPYPWRTLARHRCRTRIRHDLDPAGAPVSTVRRQDLAASRPPDPGTSHRVTVAGRAIVTVLAADGDLLTVRDATRAESARVVAAERARPA